VGRWAQAQVAQIELLDNSWVCTCECVRVAPAQETIEFDASYSAPRMTLRLVGPRANMAPQLGARGRTSVVRVVGRWGHRCGGATRGPDLRRAESTQLVTSVGMMGCWQLAAGFFLRLFFALARRPRVSWSHPRPRHRRVMWPSSPPRTPPPFHGAPCHSYRPCVLACSIPRPSSLSVPSHSRLE
jgi:hypothetical protein